MLRTFLTPLSARFSPLSLPESQGEGEEEHNDSASPEEFARDVLIELMRKSVERLKETEDVSSRTSTLMEISRIMQEDCCTKNEFREMDGFILLINALSTADVGQPRDKDVLEQIRLIFMIMSEVTKQHSVNSEYFSQCVGYHSLFQAVSPLVFSDHTQAHTLGCLLSFALQDFSLSGVFLSTQQQSDLHFPELASKHLFIHHPGAIRVLWDFLPELDHNFRHAILRILEQLSSQYHRNRAALSRLGILPELFRMYLDSKNSSERPTMQKILKRILDQGASTSDIRLILQNVVNTDESLNLNALELVRNAAKGRWPKHLSLDSSTALVFPADGVRGLPPTGFTFMAWMWIEQLPKDSPEVIFGFRINSDWLLRLSLRPDGKLAFQSAGHHDVAIFSGVSIIKLRWTHIALVYYAHRATNPSIRMFVDGSLSDSIDWAYPKGDPTMKSASYVIGDNSLSARMRWCLSSSYLLSQPLDDSLFRFIYHLSPRYTSNFHSDELVKLLTYEASTSLNIFLFNIKTTSQSPPRELINAIKFGFNAPDFVFVLTADSLQETVVDPASSNTVDAGSPNGGRGNWTILGDVVVVDGNCFDMAIWKLGGAAVALKLIHWAKNPHEISRALGVLTDILRNNWQNSEDMERHRGYDILCYLLRTKSHLINMTAFETLFEFLGLNFSSPEYSTIVNTTAYRAIALDFILWSKVNKEVQLAHLDHFTTLVETSRYRDFNVKQRYNKMGVVRKFLFVLQTELYQPDILPFLLQALRSIVQTHFHPYETIKPLVLMLAANLHEESSSSESPQTPVSIIDTTHLRDKAELVLEMLISVLASFPECLQRFGNVLPLTSACLLFLGERPSPTIASNLLLLVGTIIDTNHSFIRKFELVSGWAILRAVLPYGWNSSVSKVAFDVLLGRLGPNEQNQETPVVACPNIAPVIFAALHHSLDLIIEDFHSSPSLTLGGPSNLSPIKASDVETLVEELIRLYPISPTFRQIFKSSQTTQLFIDAYKLFISGMKSVPDVGQHLVGLMDKLSHFALALALDNTVSTSQQRELFGAIETAQSSLDPNAASSPIDPKLIPSSIFDGRISRRLSAHMGDRAIHRSISRFIDWRKQISASERKRLRRTILDLRENNRQIAGIVGWINLVTDERGIWPRSGETRMWRLDDTEGPYRVRKKLEPDIETAPNGYGINSAHDANHTDLLEVPSWATSFNFSTTDARDWIDEVTEDKHRRVRHELEPGDVIEAVFTVARVVGVDSSPGLLIFGRTNIYFLDGLVEDHDGEVIDARDAPRRLLFIPGSVIELERRQGALRWTYDQVLNYTDRAFLFRDVGIEIYFNDSRSLLLVFLEKKNRQNVHQRLSSALAIRTAADPTTPVFLKTPLVGRVSTKILSGFRPDELMTAQKKWQAREISNFTYLSILNQLSGRTPSDATQYPVFPWVLQDYSSEILDLEASTSFRDLTKPMGALTDNRRDAARSRYISLESIGEKPFHYGTHFSSSMIVCHFMIRLAPFTNMFKTLQGGDWDLPDRLFTDVKRAYESASQDIRGDVRELIPEFFTCPEFLENLANLDFGTQQNSGEKIHDVKLPPWAKQDPLLFVTMNRQALESDCVSQTLHEWINLIWGYKQRDPEALNVFHPLSYEGSIDLDKITDELEREATVGIIHNFGQTPRKVFTTPHPPRLMHGVSTLPVGTSYGVAENFMLLEQSLKVFRDIGPSGPVRDITTDQIGEKVIPHPNGVLSVPLYPHEQMEWLPTNRGNKTGELRVVVDRKIVHIVEMQASSCTCATFADSDSLVTGSDDHIVRLWRLTRTNQVPLRISLFHTMRGHQAPVVCVAASRAWSVVVSGSKDGSAIVWDLNRGVYVRSIWHERDDVHLATINESTGYIATCSREKLCLHTINARHIATLDLTSFSVHPPITSLAFLEREYSHIGILATGGCNGTIALRTWNTDHTPSGQKAKWEFKTLRQLTVRKQATDRGRDVVVTALKFMGENLYHGQEDGKVYGWKFPG